MITSVKPNSTASKEAIAALITEVLPFIAHAHGTVASSEDAQNRIPVGKGMPMKNEGTAIMIADRIHFNGSENPATD